MAIVINGSGTVTGISVGGLPDAIVDAGTLASGIDKTSITDNGNANAITIDSNEIVTMPSQPAFIANSTVSQAITNATVTTINFTSEIADRNADYDGTNTFTAPVTGLYSFSAQVILDAGTTPDTRFSEAQLKFMASNRQALFLHGDLESNADDRVTMQGTALMDMDASDTITVEAYVSRFGASGSTTTVVNAPNLLTFFTGHLVC